MSQLALDYGFEAYWERRRALYADVAASVGAKEICFELDLDRSTLSHQLAERNGHKLAARTAEFIRERDGERRLFRDDAARYGFKLEPIRAMSREELNAAKLAELERMAPDLVKIAEDRALGVRR